MENIKNFDVTGDIVALGIVDNKLATKRFINESFRSAYPREYHWLVSNYGSFKFAKSLYNYMHFHGKLTPKQLNAIKNFAIRG